jgi:N-acetylneuraminic acid mutarotase
MKNYVLLVLVVAITMSCNEDETKTGEGLGSWTRWNDFPKEGRNASLAFSINGKGYWAFGYNPTSSYIKEVWSYDPSTDSWEQKKDFPFGSNSEAVAVANGKAYVLMYSGVLYEYDPVGDSWKEKAPFPDTKYHGCVAFGLGGNVYFGTGNGTTINDAGYLGTSKSFWKYTVANNAWSQIEDLPGPPERSQHHLL